MHPRKRQRKNASAMKLVGAQLAMFREFAGLRQRELAERVCVHEETIASVEQGRRPLKPDLAKVLDRVLDTKRALETAVDNMPEIDRFPVWAAEFMDAEREAIAVSSYQNQVVPGQLQTENYARAVFRSRIPILDEDEITKRATTRIERQEILHRKNPLSISFVIWQPVLMLRLGDTETYAEQIRHLRTCAQLPGVSIQVMPLDRGSHPALDGPFILLETVDHQYLAYAETQRGSQLISDLDEVSILSQRYAMLRTQALNQEDTVGLLGRLLGEQ
ncbi:helix-turn-helix domain-containing protein [Streptomyces lunaelactis]|nr:helix-turn-helix transcriptional regulator [Streptomyces lunaelactis]NUK04216.1 helix-turn-helix domain-containing protein [Streptomyces lunaelactis]NUK10677.1 helix-turn-helix domain-containing protein [Streptomyces lunaelactis]NUK20041.1 helix-turn-helix domain-containing protein [Streptomyces lunaelactis]NUK84974.1 helix-turn-helix domain-containing protein [Streptomyces lunaelactis]NUL12599.1 helix-turn-helix domain-containing protein [Streptomyces lunaelactis]